MIPKTLKLEAIVTRAINSEECIVNVSSNFRKMAENDQLDRRD
jgi:hypothetical protein